MDFVLSAIWSPGLKAVRRKPWFKRGKLASGPEGEAEQAALGKATGGLWADGNGVNTLSRSAWGRLIPHSMASGSGPRPSGAL